MPLLNQWKEKRKYVARLGIKPRTSDLRVRCPTDCAMQPGFPLGNDHLPENWEYSPRVLKLVSLDASHHKEHEYIWFRGGDMNDF